MAKVRVRSASWLLIARILTVGFSFPLNILLARVLGASGKGVLSLVTTGSGLVVTMLGIGLPSAVTFMSARDEVGPRDVLKLGLVMSAIAGGLAVLVSALGAPWVAHAFFKTDNTFVVWLTVAIIPAATFTGFATSLLFGLGRIKEASLVTLGNIGGQLLVLSVLASLGDMGQRTALIALLSISIVIAVVLAVRVFTLPDHVGPKYSPLKLGRAGLRFGFMSWIGGAMQSLALRQDYMMLGFFANPAAVGVYSVASSLAELSWYIPSSAYGVLFPKASSEGPEFAPMIAKYTRMLLWMTAVISLVVFVVSIPLIPIVFGKEFSGAIVPLALLGPGILMSVVGMVPSAFLSGIGKPETGAVSSTANLASNVLVNLALMPAYGIKGAAVGSSVSYTAGAFVTVYYFLKYTDISLSELLVLRRADVVEGVMLARQLVAERLTRRGTDADA